MSQLEQMIFLLGGRDLEMLEINKLLEENKLTFIDKNLSWGASWKDYQDEIKSTEYKGCQFVGIELSDKALKPDNGIDIDHHNERSNEASSIEKIAELLGTDLTHWQKLVAANDKGYIPALKAIGASDQEIEEIRLADRKTQGVTEEDEKLAEESIQENLRWENGIAVIKSLTDKFSPITDRMYGKGDKLLIYTDSKLNYFGKSAQKLSEHFGQTIEEGKAYAGGGPNGYFGIVENTFNHNQLMEELIPKIIRISSSEPR